MNRKRKPTSLINKVVSMEYHPEIYVYPTPRMLAPTSNFSLEMPEFTNDLNLYVHIPFCKQICSFCGYLKVVDSKGDLKSKYVDAVLNEIELYKDILSDKVIKTLHFGGGTPSLLSPSEIETLISKFEDANPDLFKTCEEISLETTPEAVEFDRFSAYKDVGINRVSMGLQALTDEVIRLSRRNNYPEVSVKAIETLKDIGYKNIVTDLMVGIGGQTIDNFEKSVEDLIELKPDLVEVYGLGLMPNTTLGNKHSNLMDNLEKYICFERARQLFLESGYRQDDYNRYALSTGSFLQEDYLYSGQSIIGFGAGARTYASNMHYRNPYSKSHMKSVVDYIRKLQNKELAVETKFELSEDEQLRQYIIYNINKLHKDELLEKFGVKFDEKFPRLYGDLVALDFIDEDENTIKINEKGIHFTDLIGAQVYSDEVMSAEEAYRPK